MLAHIHIMKTAGQTVCDILRDALGPNHCDLRAGDLATAADVRFAQRVYPNLQSIAGHAIRPRGDLLLSPEIRFYTFLREPIARCVSHYQFECDRNGRRFAFIPWLERNADYQTKILCGSRDAQRAIAILHQHVEFVGLVDDFDRSLKLLRNWSKYDLNTHYRSRNIATAKSIKREILANPEFVAAMDECHVADHVVFRHVVKLIYPKLVEAYSDDDSTVLEPRVARLRIWSNAKRNLIYKPLANARRRIAA